MAFIPKIISFDSGGAGYPKTYDALYDSKKLDNIVKEYITLNPNHEFVQYLFAIDRYENEDDICLLYTSPSPRDRQKSRMPSSA